MGCLGGANFALEGRPADAAAERACVVNTAPDYFPTMRSRSGKAGCWTDDDLPVVEKTKSVTGGTLPYRP